MIVVSGNLRSCYWFGIEITIWHSFIRADFPLGLATMPTIFIHLGMGRQPRHGHSMIYGTQRMDTSICGSDTAARLMELIVEKGEAKKLLLDV